MSGCQTVARPLTRSLRHEIPVQFTSIRYARSFSQSVRYREQVTTTIPPTESNIPPPPPPQSATAEAKKGNLLDPETTTLKWAEQKLWKQGTPPVGSRRRRAAVRTSINVPFEQLPYQCFQEARAILAEDRAEKIAAIEAQVARIKRLEETPADKVNGGEKMKETRLDSLRRHTERLKILADINDPAVKRKFEDGLGDMKKPIYRFLAERKWREMAHKIIAQRISQFKIVPDVLPKLDPTVDVQLFFRRLRVPPGEILDSRITEVPPRLKVQAFDAGEKMVSIVVMDSDVPDPETDSFARRCHYLAANVPLSPAEQSLPLGKVDRETQLAVPWLPAFAQKGAPYHRMSIVILEQKAGEKIDIAKLRELYSKRDGFSLKSFRDKFALKPVGYNIFRTIWDEGTAGVMQRAGIPGADVEFKRVRVESLKAERKARGWEAKYDTAKYLHLKKYTRRVRTKSRW